eukprot:CAMPEP_0176102026 /NCGR_PEP_ID=MMETSP0120_2-20121206/51173_1 /TAXON_ID=160619 /ORGANISM="Kryptoperidinium foliaceum, Strain CCMP 1326" /LENGTH=240 /DNA_ID=CAMNT_0017436079 /DNA_START=87 /DNA_END=805 /DNA_ORIENTATION=+
MEELEAMYTTNSSPSGSPDTSTDTTGWGKMRLLANRLLNAKVGGAPVFDLIMGTLVLINVIIAGVESDFSADCVMSPDHCSSPEWLGGLNVFFLACYLLECAVRFYVQRKAYFYQGLNYLDALVVILGVVQMGLADGNSRHVSMLRLFRLARIVLLLKVLRCAPALWSLISGLIGALHAMSWGLILVVLLLFVWAIISVEVLHPIAWRVHTLPTRDSEWCRQSFSSVTKAALYFFVTLVA